MLYPIVYATYTTQKGGTPIPDAVRALDEVSFDRTRKATSITTEDTIFAGTLIDTETGKLTAGRTAWATAAMDLPKVIWRTSPPTPPRRPARVHDTGPVPTPCGRAGLRRPRRCGRAQFRMGWGSYSRSPPVNPIWCDGIPPTPTGTLRRRRSAAARRVSRL